MGFLLVVSGLGFRVWGLGFRVGLRVLSLSCISSVGLRLGQSSHLPPAVFARPCTLV